MILIGGDLIYRNDVCSATICIIKVQLAYAENWGLHQKLKSKTFPSLHLVYAVPTPRVKHIKFLYLCNKMKAALHKLYGSGPLSLKKGGGKTQKIVKVGREK